MLMREISVPSTEKCQGFVMRFNFEKVIATCVTSNGDLVINFDREGNDNELIIRYNNIEKANQIHDYLWELHN